MARSAAVPIPRGLTHNLEEIRPLPMWARQEEHTHAKRWREHDDRDAAHHLVTSHLRRVAKIGRSRR
jgi:RNA polymerase sigma-32 factor